MHPHRLIAIVAGGELQLISPNGHDRVAMFRAPFDKLVDAGLPPMVLDGETRSSAPTSEVSPISTR